MRLEEANQQTQPRAAAVRARGSGGQGPGSPWRGNRASVFSSVRLAHRPAVTWARAAGGCRSRNAGRRDAHLHSATLQRAHH